MSPFFYFSHEYHISFFFFFNDTATTEIYTLSLHDALPIFWQPVQRTTQEAHVIGMVEIGCQGGRRGKDFEILSQDFATAAATFSVLDRKSTRLNSSHSQISYAVFCLKKKQTQIHTSIWTCH